jgi:DNA ligase D-like protein (predicted 3'-phosphoesterase)
VTKQEASGSPQRKKATSSAANRATSQSAKKGTATTKSATKRATKKTVSAQKKASSAKKSTSSAKGTLTEYNRKRDFTKTAEPAGARSARKGKLRFVIQKHAASHLHFDLRLEMDGVMKSWAVPKGPSADPSIKRLAMQVEDHPISYNTFEGTIPEGEYGGGTVMLWDTGTYTADMADGSRDEEAALAGHERGDLKVTFHGKRMRGSYTSNTATTTPAPARSTTSSPPI